MIQTHEHKGGVTSLLVSNCALIFWKFSSFWLIISYAGQIIFIPLNVFRFHLMFKPGTLVSFVGLALYVTGWAEEHG